MRVTFLGTGTSQGVPVIACDCPVCQSPHPADQRLRSSVWVEWQGLSLVVDTGPDFRQQMLRAGTQRLDAVLYTHAHKDHTAGMDDIRAFNYRQQQDMPLYGTQATLDQLRQEFAYVFAQHKYPGIPQVRLHPITQEIFRIGPAQIVPLPVRHHRMPVLGFRFGPFAYITDANHIPPETFARLRGVEVLVLNALRQETHLSHFTLAQAVEIAQQVGARQTWLTHISHLMGRHHDVNAALPPGVALAHDGLVLELAD